MILRRLSQSLRELNWTAIAIEFVLLVLGVFLGIQVANWNEERETNRKSVEFSERLQADLREEEWRYASLIAYYREVLVSAERTAGALEGTAQVADEALLVEAYRASQNRQGFHRRSTYDELISIGAIDLIRDRTLRATAMRIYSATGVKDRVQESMQSRYREAFRMSVPNVVQRALGRRCGDRQFTVGDYASIRGVLDYGCSTGLPAADIARSAQALRSHPDLLPLLRQRIADIDTLLVVLDENRRILQNQLGAAAVEGS